MTDPYKLDGEILDLRDGQINIIGECIKSIELGEIHSECTHENKTEDGQCIDCFNRRREDYRRAINTIRECYNKWIKYHIEWQAEEAAKKIAQNSCETCCFKETNCNQEFEKESQTTSKIAYTDVKITCCGNTKNYYEQNKQIIINTMSCSGES